MPQIPITTRIATDRPLVKVDNSAIANPAAGQGFSITIPVGYRSSLVSMRLRLTCDANVAGRILHIRAVCNDLSVWEMSHTSACVATGVYVVNVGPGLPFVALGAAVFFASWPSPPQLTLQEGDQIIVSVDSIQVGDQFDLIALQTLSQFVAE